MINLKPLKMKKRKEETLVGVGEANSDEGFESSPEKVALFTVVIA